MVNIHIIFDRSDHTYISGDEIKLEIRVQVHCDSAIRSIYTKIRGFSNVEFDESRRVQNTGENFIENTTYAAHETYFTNDQPLLGSQRGPVVRLAAGFHVFHAAFVLPRHLPQSYESCYGHIRYEVEVCIDVPWDFDKKEIVPFSIKPQFNLNECQHVRESVRVEAKKTFSCLCWESDPLYIYNILPRSGYVPGDQTSFSLELNNESDVSIQRATVELVEKIVYYAQNPLLKTREVFRTLWKHVFTGFESQQLVAPLQNEVFSANLHFDPAWGFLFLAGCGIITVEYYIRSEAQVSGCHLNLTNHTKITMGTIPFENNVVPFLQIVPSTPVYDAETSAAKPIFMQPRIEVEFTSMSKTYNN